MITLKNNCSPHIFIAGFASDKFFSFQTLMKNKVPSKIFTNITLKNFVKVQYEIINKKKWLISILAILILHRNT